MKHTMKVCSILFGVIAVLVLVAGPADAADKPNIVFIMFDDLGNADLGYRGSDIKTPTIDKLATGGVRLESFRRPSQGYAYGA